MSDTDEAAFEEIHDQMGTPDQIGIAQMRVLFRLAAAHARKDEREQLAKYCAELQRCGCPLTPGSIRKSDAHERHCLFGIARYIRSLPDVR